MEDEKLLYGTEPQKTIGDEEVKKAQDILQEYKSARANLELRIKEDELWWELRHWEVIRRQKEDYDNMHPEPSSAWLFNSILNKHADAMDNYPEPVVLPREASDTEQAKNLSSILPVVMEYNDFQKTYSDNWWEKLKHGTAVYGVFWDAKKENGLGDITIKPIDLLKIFWEPGITDIQRSRNLFIVDLVDVDILNQQYPQFDGEIRAGIPVEAQYYYDESIDLTDKVEVVDWYYKVDYNGKTVLHYAKFANDKLLYSSENDPNLQAVGFYDHGMYPVVFDTLFPEKSTPVGFGYVSICKNPQTYIDQLSANILENSMVSTKKRWFVGENTNINEEEYLDWQKPLVHVQGEVNDTKIKEIVEAPMSPIYLNVMQSKIEEMKDTAANRDVNSGGAVGQVTAAAAIAALQEAGNKASRDMISASYRCYTDVVKLCIELMRQFYDESRAFRVITPVGEYQFIQMSNAGLKDQRTGMDNFGNALYRQPIFDLKIKAQKKNPFSRMEQNETAKELYRLGFFNPEKAQEAMIALDMMEFEGIEQIKEKVNQGATLLNICQQLQQQLNGMQMAMGMPPAMGGGSAPSAPAPSAPSANTNPAKAEVLEANTPMTGYGQALAERSIASIDNSSNKAAPNQ